jgi:hypothetical protein
MNCSYLLANHVCVRAPDPAFCEWNAVPIMTIPDFHTVKIIGIGSGSSTCRVQSENGTRWANNRFDFIPINKMRTMMWIAMHIQSGECPGYYSQQL